MTSLSRLNVYAGRELRKRMSHPEDLLWQGLRGLPGMKLQRQDPLVPHVVHFNRAEARGAAEIDDGAHDGAERASRGVFGDRRLERRGVGTMRINASEVLSGPGLVAQSIVEWARDPSTGLRLVSLPASGEEP